MASVEEKIGGPAIDDEVLIDGEMLGQEAAGPDSSQPDPDYITSKQLKEEAEDEGKINEGKKESETGKVAHNIKSTVIISGAVVAVIGAIFAIAKKIKEA